MILGDLYTQGKDMKIHVIILTPNFSVLQRVVKNLKNGEMMRN